jgi:hypothetical protein
MIKKKAGETQRIYISFCPLKIPFCTRPGEKNLEGSGRKFTEASDNRKRNLKKRENAS